MSATRVLMNAVVSSPARACEYNGHVPAGGAYRSIVVAWFVVSVLVFVALRTRAAPYGRHRRTGWGPQLPATWGWLIMETPAALCIAALALPVLRRDGYAQGWLLLGLWELHYVHRAFVFPF